MHIIQNYTLKKNVVNKFLPLVMALLQGIKNLFGPLLMTWTADSPTRRYGESATSRLPDAGSRRLPDSRIRGVDFRLQISPQIRIRKLVCGTYADLNYAKTSENSVHCHVPLIKFFWVNGHY